MRRFINNRFARFLLVWVAVGAIAGEAQTTNPPYLREFPSAAKVQAEIKGANAMDTAARQMGAFWQLRELIYDLAWRTQRRIRNYATPDENRLAHEYFTAHGLVALPYAPYNSPSHPDKPRWFQLHHFYETDPGFLDDLLKRFCSSEFRAGVYQLTGKQPPRQSVAQSSTTQRAETPERAPATGGAPGYVAEGHKYYAAKDYPKAIETYKKAITLAPALSDAEVFNRLGLSHYYLQQYQEALAAEQQAIRLNPGEAAYQNNLGFTYRGLRQYDKAVAAFREAARLKPGSALTYAFLGTTFLDLKQYDNAVGALRESLRIEPNNPDASNDLGYAYLELKRYPEAKAAFQQAIRLAPGKSDPQHGLGEVFLALEQYDQALGPLREEVRLDPNSPEAHAYLGNAYILAGQFLDAAASYRQAVRLKPDDAYYQDELGFAYVVAGRRNEAMQVYNTLLKLDKQEAGYLLDNINDPGGPAAVLCRRAEILVLAHDDSGALAAYRNALRLKPTKPSVILDIGFGFQLVQHYEEALQLFRGVIATKPDAESLSSAYGGIGSVYIDTKDYEKAVAALQQARRIQPSYITSDQLGEAYVELKQFPQAVAAFKEAVRLKPDYDSGYLHLGQTYLQMKQFDQALLALKEASRLAPKSAQPHNDMGSAYLQLGQYPNAVAEYSEAIRLYPDSAEAQYGLGTVYRVMGRKAEALRVCRTLQGLDKDLAQKLYAQINQSR